MLISVFKVMNFLLVSYLVAPEGKDLFKDINTENECRKMNTDVVLLSFLSTLNKHLSTSCVQLKKSTTIYSTFSKVLDFSQLHTKNRCRFSEASTRGVH